MATVFQKLGLICFPSAKFCRSQKVSFPAHAKYFHGLSLLCMFAFTFQFCLLSLLKERETETTIRWLMLVGTLCKSFDLRHFLVFCKNYRSTWSFFLKLKIQKVDPKQHLFGKLQHNVEVATPSNI